MESIPRHITPLVINSLGADTNTHIYRRPHRNNYKKPGALGLAKTAKLKAFNLHNKNGRPRCTTVQLQKGFNVKTNIIIRQQLSHLLTNKAMIHLKFCSETEYHHLVISFVCIVILAHLYIYSAFLTV